MSARETVNRIAETLRELSLSWLLVNLRQDAVVWNALNDPAFFDKVIQSAPAGPADFSPASLACLALDRPDFCQIDLNTSLDSMVDQVAQIAIQSVGERANLGMDAQELASAGLVAISLLKKFEVSHSWKDLLYAIDEHPQPNWMLRLACLYGLLDDPSDLLRALVYPGASSSLLELAVHCILCNPHSTGEQVAILVGLCHGDYGGLIPASDRVSLLHALSETHPRLAGEFGKKWLEIHPQPSSRRISSSDLAGHVCKLSEGLFQVEIRRIAGAQSELAGYLDGGLVDAHGFLTSVVSRYLTHHADLQPGLSCRNDAGIFDKAVKLGELSLSKDSFPEGAAELALALAGQGLMEEAKRFLPVENGSLPDNVDSLFAVAKLSFIKGDVERCWQAASHLMALLEQKSALHRASVWGDGFSLVSLARLLLDLRKPAEAAQVLERAVHACPSDPGLLRLLSVSYQSARNTRQSAETLDILVSMNPNSLDDRRLYAQSLEDLGEWQSGLYERRKIIESGDAIASLLDKYAYAHCAIEARLPDLALEICRAILEGNQEDSQALIYIGEAHLLMDETGQGMEYLTRATQVAPDRPETWLALAVAQQKYSSKNSVLETLKNASLAVPASAEIRYTLGDAYMQDDQPTLALPELQSAVELSPHMPKFLARYANALQSLGHFEACREMYSLAYLQEPEFPGLALSYSKILVELGKLDEAVAPYETLLHSKSVNGPGPYLDYARCVLALNKRGSTVHPPLKALIALNEVLQMDPQHAEAKALTAEALAANGEYDLAFQAYREALDTPLTEDKAWFERLSFGLGCVAASLGKQDIAIAALQDAGQANPENPAIFMALSDAYIAANLPEDALRSARAVVVTDKNNPDHLAWFAGQIAKLSGSKNSASFGSCSAVSKGVISEALSSLAKAIQLAPTRTDLLVQLGNFQSSIGEGATAQATFASIANLDFATVDDLLIAAKYLGEIDDHLSAIACLERGISIDSSAAETHAPGLYASLAGEYVKSHDPTSSIHTLDKAIEIMPGESSLVALKADILVGLGQSSDALDVIEQALQKNPHGHGNLDLHFLASHINRCVGNFPASLNHARLVAALASKKDTDHANAELSIPQRTHLADLYRALLQPEQALAILQDGRNLENSNFSTNQDFLDFIFLHTELALSTGERIRPDIQDVKLEASHPGFSRLMAINARLMNKAGNYKQAEQLFHLAFSKLVSNEATVGLQDWSAPYARYLGLVGMLEAAQELGLWDQALASAQQVADSAPAEPFSHLSLASSLVLRAEFDQCCELFDVTQHRPLTNAWPNEVYESCMGYLDQARSCLGSYQGETIVIGHELNDEHIRRWQARAGIIFDHSGSDQADPVEVLLHQALPGDIAAIISHIRQGASDDPEGDALNRMLKLARLFPRNPSVILQLAFYLRDGNPQEAMKSLQSVLEHNPYARNPSVAFCNILLAQTSLALGDYEISKQAVEKAISFWQNEPAWHQLAARIYHTTGAIGTAIQHLEEAASLAPGNLACHVELGELLSEHANDDELMLAQALISFEKAYSLDPKNVTVLVNLANTYFCMHDFAQAEVKARDALVLAPDRADLYRLIGRIALEKNDYQSAYEFAGKAIQIDPMDSQSTVLIARALTAMGRYQEALAKLNAALPSIQEARPIHLERVNIIRRVSGPQVALNELNTLANNYPDDFYILEALSKSFYEAGELENAVVVAQRALDAHSESTSSNDRAGLHIMIGQALRQSGELDRSIEHLSAAMQLAPNRLEPYLELGMARKERREYQQALKIFEQATQIAPHDPRALFQAGMALKESKDYKSSETMLRRAVSLAPNDLSIRRQLAAVVALNLIHNPRSARINA